MRTSLLAIGVFCVASAYARDETVLILDKDGKVHEGQSSLSAIFVNGRKIALSGVLSIHSGEPASAHEAARIQAGMAGIQAYKNEIIQSDARRNRDAAVEEIAAIGIPAMTPLLRAYKDTDQHEPRPLYRLFERVMPSEADQLDRTASLVRLSTGELLRGKVDAFAVTLNGAKIPWQNIRRLAVRRKTVARFVELHSIRHSTQIEYLDTGVIVTPESNITSKATGFVRLSWDTDGWASDANGLKVPGPNYKTNLVDGHAFGAIVGRIRSSGEVFLVGAQFSRKGLGTGPLHLAVNDNRHWQNNLGAFRVALQVTNAYDAGAAQ